MIMFVLGLFSWHPTLMTLSVTCFILVYFFTSYYCNMFTVLSVYCLMGCGCSTCLQKVKWENSYAAEIEVTRHVDLSSTCPRRNYLCCMWFITPTPCF